MTTKQAFKRLNQDIEELCRKARENAERATITYCVAEDGLPKEVVEDEHWN